MVKYNNRQQHDKFPILDKKECEIWYHNKFVTSNYKLCKQKLKNSKIEKKIDESTYLIEKITEIQNAGKL